MNITCKCVLPIPPPAKLAKSLATGANAISLGVCKTPTFAKQQRNFISEDFVKKYKIPIYKLSDTHQITMADRQVQLYTSEYVQVTLKMHDY